jgi:hypothetical protein
VIPDMNLYGENNPVNFVDPSGYLANTLGPMIDRLYTFVEVIARKVKVSNSSDKMSVGGAVSATLASSSGARLDEGKANRSDLQLW